MYKIAQSHTCQKWGRMKVRETTSVQEHVVLTNIKALDLCVCECMYTHTITHTHAQTALSLACIDFKIIFSFITYSRQNIMAIGFDAFMFSQSRRKFTNKCFSTEREHMKSSFPKRDKRQIKKK